MGWRVVHCIVTFLKRGEGNSMSDSGIEEGSVAAGAEDGRGAGTGKGAGGLGRRV